MEREAAKAVASLVIELCNQAVVEGALVEADIVVGNQPNGGTALLSEVRRTS